MGIKRKSRKTSDELGDTSSKPTGREQTGNMDGYLEEQNLIEDH